MRIVHLYKDYHPPTVGGIEKTVERMARAQARAGHDVSVLVSAHGGRRTLDERLHDVRVIRVAEWARFASAPLCPTMPLQLARLGADVWNLHFPNPTGEVSWLLRRPRGAMVVTYHSDIVRQVRALRFYAPVVRALLARADVIMPTSEAYIERSRFLRQHRAKCQVVPHAIDLETFDHHEDRAIRVAELRVRTGGAPLVVFVGRLVPYKGLDVLLEAMRKVEARCVIVGGGPELERLRTLSAGLGLESRVTFTGRLEQDRLVDQVAAADVGVLPSISLQEAYGLAMAEMMALGLPVVCTEVGTGTSFVNRHGETGLVVPPRDPGALAAALNRLLSDTPERERMGRNARERARRLFSTDAMMRALTEVYEQVLARRRGA